MTEPPAAPPLVDNEENREILAKKSVAALKSLLRQHGYQVSGKKSELVERLFEPPPFEPPTQWHIRNEIVYHGHGHLEQQRLQEKEAKLRKLTVTELQAKCKRRGRHVGGTKHELISRLLDQSQKKRKPVEKSAVARLLKQDVFDCNDLHSVTGQPLDAEALRHQRTQYQRYNIDVFESFLEKVRQQHNEMKAQAATDDKEVLEQLQYLSGMNETTHWGYQSWRNHPGKKPLRAAMDQGLHTTMTKQELYNHETLHAIREDMSLAVFKDRIAQEERARKQTNWNRKIQAELENDSASDCDSVYTSSDDSAND